MTKTTKAAAVKDMNAKQLKTYRQLRAAVESFELYDRIAGYFYISGVRKNGERFNYMITPDGYLNDARAL